MRRSSRLKPGVTAALFHRSQHPELLSLPTRNDKEWRGSVASKYMTANQLPYCDLHYAPMRPYFTGTFCGCTKDRLCKRRYDTFVGYYAHGPGDTRHPCCPTHYSPLFVCAYDSRHDLRQYGCPVQGCEYLTEWLPKPR